MKGLDLEGFTSNLDWRQFEAFAELAFRSFGFRTIRNYRLKKPRMEIDLVAFRDGMAFAVDCKHWKRTVGYSAMTHVGERQIVRSKHILKKEPVDRVVPVILTWHDELLEILENGVPVVPIQKISDFILNWESSAGEIVILSKQNNEEDEEKSARNATQATLF